MNLIYIFRQDLVYLLEELATLPSGTTSCL